LLVANEKIVFQKKEARLLLIIPTRASFRNKEKENRHELIISKKNSLIQKKSTS
jgi:hypothetical protein